MRNVKIALIVLVCGLTGNASNERRKSPGLHFEANLGQAAPIVNFLARAPNYEIFLTSSGVALRSTGSVFRMSFEGSSADPEVVLQGRSETRAHYLIGSPELWHLEIPMYDQVEYRDIYPGVDVVYHADASQRLEYDLVIHPGADVSQIRLRLEGEKPPEIDGNGDLVARGSSGEWRQTIPDVYEVRGGSRRKRSARLLTAGGGEVAFAVSDYDHSVPLVIDPALIFSTYLGGSGQSSATAVATDATGNAYVTGWTESLDFPESHGYQLGNPGGVDAYIAKFSAAGQLLYITYLGGKGDDRAFGIAVDDSGEAIIAGWTYSSNFPVVNASQTRLGGGRDGFVAKLNPAGNGLVFSTYWGGSGLDNANAVALDTTGTIYVTGETASANFPILNAFQTKTGGGDDAFVAKFGSTGSALFSTYLGGLADDRATGIAVDAAGNAYVTGSTSSYNFPVVNAFQSVLGGGQDAFAAKISSSGNELLYSTYLGGSGGTASAPETGNAIDVDSDGCAYITGTTSSADFPTVNPLQSTISGSQDAFVVKLGVSGSALVYSTYLGGSSLDVGTGVVVDDTGEVYVTGYTASTDFPIANAVQSSNAGGYDVFVAELNPAGNVLITATYLGGSGSDAAYGIGLRGNEIYIVGQTLSTSFPVVGAVQSFETAAAESFVAALPADSQPPVVPTVHIDSPAPGGVASGIVNLSGWAIDNASVVGTGIRRVQVLVDGVAVGDAVYGVPRPDVCAAYPGRPGCPNVGFSFQWNTASISPGTHTVTVAATDSAATLDTGTASVTVTVTAVPPSVHIDLPAPGSVISGSVSVAGWAVDNTSAPGTAIGSVQVRVDGQLLGNATYGLSRPDVCAAYPSRPGCPNVGFSYQLNLAALSAGTHTISISATDTDAIPDVGTASVTVTVANAPPSVCIDVPASGSVASGTVTVAGWALDNTTAVGTMISAVQVKLDGSTVGNAMYGVSRPDVCSAYSGRAGCPNVGFAYNLDTTQLSPGPHSLTISATNSDVVPDVGTASVTFQVAAAPPSVHIDVPANGATVSGTVQVAGWALDNTSKIGTAISRVQLLVDGVVVGNATYGVSRPDVCTAYPGRIGCPNVGYTYSLNASALSSGAHTITVAATDSDQMPDTGSASITVIR